MAGKKWTIEEIDYLKKNYPDKLSKDVAEKLNRSLCSVYTQAQLLGLKKSKEFMDSEKSGRKNVLAEGGKPYRYPKGHTPFNKGLKQEQYLNQESIEKTSKTRFRKGHKPHNTKHDGAISVRKDNTGVSYLYIRVEEGKWELLHRKIWEQHYGTIPKGYNIVFKDGDQSNVSIDNLEMVSNKDLMLRNSVQRYPEDLRRLIQVSGALNRQINKVLQDEK